MMRRRFFQSLLLLFAAVLLAAGPGSPLCTVAVAAPAGGPAMAGCDMRSPAKKTPLPAHLDCASPCTAIACQAPDMTPVNATKIIPSDPAMRRLDGLDPAPEVGPPRP